MRTKKWGASPSLALVGGTPGRSCQFEVDGGLSPLEFDEIRPESVPRGSWVSASNVFACNGGRRWCHPTALRSAQGSFWAQAHRRWSPSDLNVQSVDVLWKIPTWYFHFSIHNTYNIIVDKYFINNSLFNMLYSRIQWEYIYNIPIW